jgi:MFS superfamily sulfate permease-like transporter
LCLEAGDRIDPYRRTSPSDRELLAQGAGNIVSGLAGGLPLTAVIVRTSANVQAGGATRWSAVFHGGLLIGSVLLFPQALSQIPLGALAAVLLTVGYKLAPMRLFKEMYSLGTWQFVPFLATVVATVLTDLLTGVMIGLVFGLVGVIVGSLKSSLIMVHEGNDWMIRFTRDVSFLHKHAVRRALAEVPDAAALIIDMTEAGFVDPDVGDVLDRFMEKRTEAGRDVRLVGTEGKMPPSLSAH